MCGYLHAVALGIVVRLTPLCTISRFVRSRSPVAGSICYSGIRVNIVTAQIRIQQRRFSSAMISRLII